jgi:hypothetical protein
MHGCARYVLPLLGVLWILRSTASSSAQDAYEPNDALAQSTFVGGPLREPAEVGTQLVEVDDAVLEAGDAPDMYSFTCFAGVPIAIRVTPREDGVNPVDARNLALRLWRRTSAANNTFELFAQIDLAGAGEDEVHPPFPYGTAGFLVVEVYSTDGLQAVQHYTLRISNAEIPPDDAPPVQQDAHEPNDTLATSTFVGGTLKDPVQAGTQLLEVDDAVLEAGDAPDMYSFTCFAGVPIAIRVTPRQDAEHPSDARNLALRLWRRTSAANNTFELFAQIDLSGAGEDEVHPPTPYATAGFLVVEVYSTDGLQAVQPYTLRISNAEIPPLAGSPDLIVELDGEVLRSGSTVNLGEVPLTATSRRRLTLRNGGGAPLVFNGRPRLEGAHEDDFYTSGLAAQIEAGAETSLAIGFLPQALGPRSASLTLRSNDPDGGSFTLLLEGFGLALAPEIHVVPEALDFGEVPGGTASELGLLVVNQGTAGLPIGGLLIEGAGATAFRFGRLPLPLPSPFEIPPGRGVKLPIQFAPPAGTPFGTSFTAELVILSTDSDEARLSVPLKGTSIAESTVDLDLGLPRLESLSFDIVVAGLTVPVQLLLGVDPLGLVIATGPCTVGAVEVEVLGKKLKLRKQTGRWAYQLRLREPETKTSLKVEGELGSGRAKVRYSGPAGKATLTDVLVAEAATLDTVTLLTLRPVVDDKGRITGQGWIRSGLGNDGGAAPGVLKGRVKGDKVAWTLKQTALKRKLSFKGLIEGDELVGDLKYAIPPGKGKLEGVRLPAVGFAP